MYLPAEFGSTNLNSIPHGCTSVALVSTRLTIAMGYFNNKFLNSKFRLSSMLEPILHKKFTVDKATKSSIKTPSFTYLSLILLLLQTEAEGNAQVNSRLLHLIRRVGRLTLTMLLCF